MGIQRNLCSKQEVPTILPLSCCAVLSLPTFEIRPLGHSPLSMLHGLSSIVPNNQPSNSNRVFLFLTLLYIVMYNTLKRYIYRQIPLKLHL